MLNIQSQFRRNTRFASIIRKKSLQLTNEDESIIAAWKSFTSLLENLSSDTKIKTRFTCFQMSGRTMLGQVQMNSQPEELKREEKTCYSTTARFSS